MVAGTCFPFLLLGVWWATEGCQIGWTLIQLFCYPFHFMGMEAGEHLGTQFAALIMQRN